MVFNSVYCTRHFSLGTNQTTSANSRKKIDGNWIKQINNNNNITVNTINRIIIYVTKRYQDLW